jgi:DNA invertase Pin-like site-specific DNA recombinase
MIYGYARVSTVEQNLDRQIDMLKQKGVNELFTEKMSGTKKNRPELDKLLEALKTGDTIIVESLSRLGRSTKNLIELVELFQEKGVHLVSLKEAIDTSTPSGKLLFTLMSAIAQFERDIIAERTSEGLKAARARGHMGGRPKTDESKLAQAQKLYDSKEYTIREIEELTVVKKSTLYRHIQNN